MSADDRPQRDHTADLAVAAVRAAERERAARKRREARQADPADGIAAAALVAARLRL